MVWFIEVKENISERRYFYFWVFKLYDVFLYKLYIWIKGMDSFDVNLKKRIFKNYEDFVCNVFVGYMFLLIWMSFILCDIKKYILSFFLNKGF